MPVRLRIAGIYYDKTFEFAELITRIPAIDIPGREPPSLGKPTILELLEAAYRDPGEDKEDFIYVFERRGISLSITSLGVTLKEGLVGSLGDKFRPAGSYQLTEIDIPSGVVAWQYYVYRDGISVSQLPKPSGAPVTAFSPAKGNGTTFTGFDQFEFELEGDPLYEVIWRQVAILRGPNVPNG